MDLKKVKNSFLEYFKKDKLVQLVFILGICGIALIYLSTWLAGDKNEEKPIETKSAVTSIDYEQKLEDSLKRIVSAITGEEEPEVMVTLESTGRFIYASDEKTSVQENSEAEKGGSASEDREIAHIVLKDENGSEHALTVTEIQPKVKGVVIVSRYAVNPTIREKLTEAVRTALDVSSAKVCVTDSG